MGACTVSFILKGEPTPKVVHEQLDALRKEQEYENGHQEGYSGDFQTIYDIKFPNQPIFKTLDEAYDFAIDSTEKREAMVVKYESKDGSINTLVAGWAAC